MHTRRVARVPLAGGCHSHMWIPVLSTARQRRAGGSGGRARLKLNRSAPAHAGQRTARRFGGRYAGCSALPPPNCGGRSCDTETGETGAKREETARRSGRDAGAYGAARGCGGGSWRRSARRSRTERPQLRTRFQASAPSGTEISQLKPKGVFIR